MASPHAAAIVLSDAERAELQSWMRRRTSAAGLAVRAKIVLAAADGGSNVELADRLELDRGTIRKWRNRFVQYRCDGLLDEPRPGRPRIVGDDQIEALITATLETTPPDATHWSPRQMAEHLGLSRSLWSRGGGGGGGSGCWFRVRGWLVGGGLSDWVRISRIGGGCQRIRCSSPRSATSSVGIWI